MRKETHVSPENELWTQKPELFTTEISTNCTFWAQQYNLLLSKLNLSMPIREYSRTIINRLEQPKQTFLMTKRHICSSQLSPQHTTPFLVCVWPMFHNYSAANSAVRHWAKHFDKLHHRLSDQQNRLDVGHSKLDIVHNFRHLQIVWPMSG